MAHAPLEEEQRQRVAVVQPLDLAQKCELLVPDVDVGEQAREAFLRADEVAELVQKDTLALFLACLGLYKGGSTKAIAL